MISLAEAIARLVAAAVAPAGCEELPLDAALGRVLARDAKAGLDVPPADNSAMDGYALRHADAGLTLPVSQRIAAGDPVAPLAEGSVARIFTGAEIPPGADTVLIQEDARLLGELVEVPGALQPGQNIRRRGEDCRRGDLLLARGRRLRPQDLGLLASQGVGRVPVYPRLRVALLCTGSELREPISGAADEAGAAAQAPGPGAIYNSNGPMLEALLRSLGIEVLNHGIVRDSREGTRDALLRGQQDADVILSCGGVSVGEADFVRQVVAELGEISLWRVAVKPGKPFAFGQVRGTPFLGLPGNPASAFVTFVLLARPYLLAMQGCTDVEAKRFPALADFSLGKPGEREEYLRVTLRVNDGELRATAYGNQSSGVLRSLVAGDALACIPAGSTVAPGDLVQVLPLDLLTT